jgi:catechol 2,3-dioxygenase-like lactoylglutathione lyase family enzyme
MAQGSKAIVEHVNLTVKNPDATAQMLCDLFGWRVRWSGDAIHGGRTVHVGGETSYLALYTGPGGDRQTPAQNSYVQLGGLNHIGIVVDDLDAIEARVKAAGFTPHSHADYEPGRRFYFHDGDGIEFEVVSYG